MNDPIIEKLQETLDELESIKRQVSRRINELKKQLEALLALDD